VKPINKNSKWISVEQDWWELSAASIKPNQQHECLIVMNVSFHPVFKGISGVEPKDNSSEFE